MHFFRALLNPQAEELEFPERLEIASAANILDVGEFQVLEMAYRAWYGRDMPPAMVDSIFRQYMYRSVVPHWARHYARRIVEQARQGELAPPGVGRPVPLAMPLTRAEAVRRGIYIVGFLAAVLIVSALIGRLHVGRAISILPPFFSEEELRPAPQPVP